MKPEADANAAALRPLVRFHCSLSAHRGGASVRGLRENGEQRIALRTEFVAFVFANGAADEFAMGIEKRRPLPVAQLTHHPRRPFDVGKEERDGARGKLGHRGYYPL